MTALSEQGSAALVESKDLVEGGVHRGFQGGGAKKVSHSGQLLVVNFDQPLRHIIKDIRSSDLRYLAYRADRATPVGPPPTGPFMAPVFAGFPDSNEEETMTTGPRLTDRGTAAGTSRSPR
jgi:hypothetical protein